LWQEDFLRGALGASILGLTSRQVGKTTVAAWANLAELAEKFTQLLALDRRDDANRVADNMRIQNSPNLGS
jgi:hypothetical protein